MEIVVKHLKAKTKEDAIDELTSFLVALGKITDEEGFKQRIFERERLGSTGIGLGVAVPHARSEDYKELFVVMGLSPGIPWGAPDRIDVETIFMVAGPEDDPDGAYLELLQKITRFVRSQTKNILHAQDGSHIHL